MVLSDVVRKFIGFKVTSIDTVKYVSHDVYLIRNKYDVIIVIKQIHLSLLRTGSKTYLA